MLKPIEGKKKMGGKGIYFVGSITFVVIAIPSMFEGVIVKKMISRARR